MQHANAAGQPNMSPRLTGDTNEESPLVIPDNNFNPKTLVNKEKLESILASKKSMQNYEDALWGFESTLNTEIDSSRMELIQKMSEIQKTHDKSDAYQNTHDSLRALSQSIELRQNKVRHLRNQINDIELQNNRFMRQDEHKKALVDQGLALLKFVKLDEDQESMLKDADLYANGEAEDIQLICKALDAIQQSLVLYNDQHKSTQSNIRKSRATSTGDKSKNIQNPKFVREKLNQLIELRKKSV